MSDLVNRLRGQYAIGPDGEFGMRKFGDFIPAINLEAAVEIERLNARVKELEQKIIDHNYSMTPDWERERK